MRLRSRFIFCRSADGSTAIPALPLSPPRRWMGLVRNNGPFWQQPVYGSEWQNVPAETQFLLWEKSDGAFGVVIPVIDGDWRSTARGTKGGLNFNASSGAKAKSSRSVRVAYVAEGKSPFQLVKEAMQVIANTLKTFRLREEKMTPSFIDYLGWCTWDAFYQDVSEARVRRGLRSLRAAGIQPGFIILDDGWLDVTDDFLNDFTTHPKKFPKGLASTISSAKREFGVKHFGVWHAFQGYWAGVNPQGELAHRYSLQHSRGMIRWWEKKVVELHWVRPNEIARFYQEFYCWLRQEGVDFTKTDGQSALEEFSGKTFGRVSTMACYQEALQGAAMTHFGTGPIHCMANGSDVAFHLSASNLWRNSDDYFPKQPVEKQQWHVHMNALNNVWTNTFAIPDWDMFQTHGPVPEFHAAARALSGGPIYICDKPGKHRRDIIDKITLSDHRILRFEQPALPSEDCLFVDFRQESRLLKITNFTGDIAVFGLFHCTPGTGSLTELIRIASFNRRGKGPCAVFLHHKGTVHLVKAQTTIEVSIRPAEFEIATVTPLYHGWGIFGLVEKYAPPLGVLTWDVTSKRTAVATMKDGGPTGFCAPSRPKTVLVNGRKAIFSYDEKSHFLKVESSLGKSVKIEINIY